LELFGFYNSTFFIVVVGGWLSLNRLRYNLSRTEPARNSTTQVHLPASFLPRGRLGRTEPNGGRYRQ